MSLDWDDVRLFIQVAEHKSFRAAGQVLETSTTTVSNHVKAMEDALGQPLFIRTSDGVKLTQFGDTILKEAREMAMAAMRISERVRSSGEDLRGEVRISMTEGLGSFWLLPRLIQFQKLNPNISLHTFCSMQSYDVSSHKVDIAVQLMEPADQDLIIKRLGWMHIMPFMSRHYRDAFGQPTSLSELKDHKLVLQASDQLKTPDLLRAIGVDDPVGVVSFWADSSSANYSLVSKGAGIGILPVYSTALGANLLPVDIGAAFKYEVLMTFHESTGRSPLMRHVIDFIEGCFDHEKFPWFREEFMDPTEIEKMPRTDWEINLPEQYKL